MNTLMLQSFPITLKGTYNCMMIAILLCNLNRPIVVTFSLVSGKGLVCLPLGAAVNLFPLSNAMHMRMSIIHAEFCGTTYHSFIPHTMHACCVLRHVLYDCMCFNHQLHTYKDIGYLSA